MQKRIIFQGTSKTRVARLLGVIAGILVLALIARTVLIHRMLLPRLAIVQGGNVVAVAIAPDGQTLFAGADTTPYTLHVKYVPPADVFVWNAVKGRLIRPLSAFSWRANGVTVSPDGHRVIACGTVTQNVGHLPKNARNEQVISWDWRAGKQLWSVNGGLPLSYSPDGRFIGSGNAICSAATGKAIFHTLSNIDWDGQNGFSPDSKLFGIIGGATISRNPEVSDDSGIGKSFYSTNRLHLWHTDTGKEAKDFPFPRVCAFDFAHDGHWLVITGDPEDAVMGSADRFRSQACRHKYRDCCLDAETKL